MRTVQKIVPALKEVSYFVKRYRLPNKEVNGLLKVLEAQFPDQEVVYKIYHDDETITIQLGFHEEERISEVTQVVKTYAKVVGLKFCT